MRSGSPTVLARISGILPIAGSARIPGYGPVAAQVFFVSLVFLDPLVVVLVLRMRPAVVWLAGAVMAVDLAANWFDNWPSLTAEPPRLVGMLPITLFGLLVLASMVPLRRSLSATGSPHPK